MTRAPRVRCSKCRKWLEAPSLYLARVKRQAHLLDEHGVLVAYNSGRAREVPVVPNSALAMGRRKYTDMRGLLELIGGAFIK